MDREHKRVGYESLYLFIFLSIPFYLNDFANIYLSDFRTWLAIDYTFVKALPLATVYIYVKSGKISPGRLGLAKFDPDGLYFMVAAVTVAGIFIDQVSWSLFEKLIPGTSLGRIPEITNSFWNKFDLTVGLAFVAITEEIVFRGLAHDALRRWIRSDFLFYLCTSLIFGTIHWSLGMHAIISTAIVGAFFMYVLVRTGSIAPQIIAHFFINFVAFSGMIPAGQ